MNWYYSNGETAVGPLGETSMAELHRCGVILSDTQVIREGSDEWMPFHVAFTNFKTPPPTPGTSGTSLVGLTLSRVAGGISSAAGLEVLDGGRAKGVFGSIFRKRTAEEMEECFAVGTSRTTPPLSEVGQGWPAPWVFVRLLAFSVLVTLAFTWAIIRFQNPNLYPGWVFMGAFSIPFSVMVFFLETNTPGNISFYRVLKLFFLGGLLSLVFSLFLFDATGVGLWLGPVAAGPIEETGKLLAVVAVARKWSGIQWTLNGLLLGSAVGAGFAAFETAGYIANADAFGGTDFGTMIMRGLLAPFTHVIWTAAAAGALWRHMGGRRFALGMLFEWPVLRILAISIGLHMLWNSSLTFPILGDVAKFVALGAVGWILVLLLIQDGIAQVTKAVAVQQEASEKEVPEVM
ncbi:PrsW family glutamic-type intramembrane protease [Luteolibacter flavescens]|uniref:PrsW family glutamic-type intramembrane protease n=1 Tax=Luteolibacter flavescens TaxID=1859460 RepID=A0ABT3FSZ4_9BACT|nr:PrsW family glutamic-type intramembrane protease [Luteolibacter flavescens]MCW1886704.1 PrsW family glutamic-type intramembrane protease [Luteolibacter flavescens]